MTLFDQTSDLNGTITYSITKLVTLPEFVKNASSEDVRGPEDIMPGTAYADAMSKQFPVHTKAATWMSMAFLLNHEDDMQPHIVQHVADQLEKAAGFYEITDDIDLLVEEWQKAKTAAFSMSDDDYALVIRNGNQTERHYPLRNAKEVQAAAEYLEKWADDIEYDDRVTIANRILEKANEFGAFLFNVEFVEKQAGHGGCSPEAAANLLWDRVQRFGDMSNPTEFQIELGKMAKACLEKPDQMTNEDTLVKLASIINTIDKIHRLEYSDTIQRPEDVLFNFTKTAASKYLTEHVKTTSGCVYKVADFANLNIEDVRDLLGNDFAEEVSDGELFVSPTKMAEQAAALPKPDAELLDRMLWDIGIEPMSKEAATDNRLSGSDLRELAALRQT